MITYYYTPVGNIDHITYPNGTETDYGYDTLNRLTSVTNKVTGGNTLSSYSYTLNADGLRTGVTETDILPSTVTKTWTYDNLQRLTGEAVVSSVSGQSYTDTYSYDLVGAAFRGKSLPSHFRGARLSSTLMSANASGV